MVVVEDLISTGGSVLEAVVAAKREGADVLGVVANLQLINCQKQIKTLQMLVSNW